MRSQAHLPRVRNWLIHELFGNYLLQYLILEIWVEKKLFVRVPSIDCWNDQHIIAGGKVDSRKRVEGKEKRSFDLDICNLKIMLR